MCSAAGQTAKHLLLLLVLLTGWAAAAAAAAGGETGAAAKQRREGTAPCPYYGQRLGNASICYTHIPKTGGRQLITSMREMLTGTVQRVGHFCNCFDRPEPIRIMLLRDPLERLWSSYFHQKTVFGGPECQAAWPAATQQLAGCIARGNSCGRSRWRAVRPLRACACCGLPSDYLFFWAMKHDPALHGYLALSFLQAFNASSAKARQLQFLATPGAHNIQSQGVLSNATLEACLADLQSANCTESMQTDLASYALIGFTQHHAAFAEDLIRLACLTAAGVNASACSIGGKPVSAAAFGGGGGGGGDGSCCWVRREFVCGAECQGRRRDEAVDEEAADLARRLNGLDRKLYEMALAMAGERQTVFRPGVRVGADRRPQLQLQRRRRLAAGGSAAAGGGSEGHRLT